MNHANYVHIYSASCTVLGECSLYIPPRYSIVYRTPYKLPTTSQKIKHSTINTNSDQALEKGLHNLKISAAM